MFRLFHSVKTREPTVLELLCCTSRDAAKTKSVPACATSHPMVMCGSKCTSKSPYSLKTPGLRGGVCPHEAEPSTEPSGSAGALSAARPVALATAGRSRHMQQRLDSKITAVISQLRTLGSLDLQEPSPRQERNSQDLRNLCRLRNFTW
jgi:hypothetical protein